VFPVHPVCWIPGLKLPGCEASLYTAEIMPEEEGEEEVLVVVQLKLDSREPEAQLNT
jgi:hypothetical protein